MQGDQVIKIPSSIQKNPLNYIRPLIVNLYYKTPVPPVGSYDVTLPEEISKVTSNPSKLTYKHVF